MDTGHKNLLSLRDLSVARLFLFGGKTMSAYQFARRCLPATAAAATATATVAAVTFLTSKSYKTDDSGVNVGIGGSGDSNIRRGFGSERLLSNKPTILPLYSPTFLTLGKSIALCETPSAAPQPYKPSDPVEPVADLAVKVNSSDGKDVQKWGMWGEEKDGMYHGLFPRRQLWRPRLEYPLWDKDWDGRRPSPMAQVEGIENENFMTEAQRERYIRKKGVTKHIILIRHGQYDETSTEDSKRLLTQLGRRQAELTGERIGKLIRGVNKEFGPCRVKVVRVSDLARAKETADLIYDNMDLENFDGEVEKADPDPLLNEGRPCHHIPGGKARPSVVECTDQQHPRIEQAFRKYFFRADLPALASTREEKTGGKDDGGKTDIIASSSNESNAVDKKTRTVRATSST